VPSLLTCQPKTETTRACGSTSDLGQRRELARSAIRETHHHSLRPSHPRHRPLSPAMTQALEMRTQDLGATQAVSTPNKASHLREARRKLRSNAIGTVVVGQDQSRAPLLAKTWARREMISTRLSNSQNLRQQRRRRAKIPRKRWYRVAISL